MTVRRGRGGEGRRPPSRRSVNRGLGRAAAQAAETGRQFGEMQVAAAQTIAMRTFRMAHAAMDPINAPDPEYALMVTEKVDAATQSMAASSQHLADPALHGFRWLNDWMTLCTRAMVETAAAPRLDNVATQMHRFVEGVMLMNAAYSAALLTSAAEMGKAALTPVHRAASGNAKRLLIIR